jgi:hypothetical protein
MQELVTLEQANNAMRLLAMALPAIGLVAGLLVGAARRQVGRGLLGGLLVGLCGPALWALWRMYNGIVGVYGLDSVRGLLVNLGLFVAIGLAAGVVVGLVWRRANAIWARRG